MSKVNILIENSWQNIYAIIRSSLWEVLMCKSKNRFSSICHSFYYLSQIKGIHPREPRNRKRAQKGDMTKIKTMYHEKDVRFLLHEPIVWKFRDFKVFLKKLKKAYAKGNENAAERLKSNKPR